MPDSSKPERKPRSVSEEEDDGTYGSSDEEQLSVTTPFLRSQQNEQAQHDTHIQIEPNQHLQSPSFRFGQTLNHNDLAEKSKSNIVSGNKPPRRPKLRLSTSYRPASEHNEHVNNNSDNTNNNLISTLTNTITSYLPTTSDPSQHSTAINITTTTTSPPTSPSNNNNGPQSRRFLSPPFLALVLAVVALIATDLTTGLLSSLINGTFSDISSSSSGNTKPPPLPHPPQNSGTESGAVPNAISGQPTKTDGVPPPSLPSDNPLSPMLHALRAQSVVTPRWPLREGSDVSRLRTFGPAYASIIISHVLKVVYIPVFKVATTSMMYMIAFLEGNKPILDAMARKDGSHMALLHDMGSIAWKNHTVFNLDSERLQEILDDPTYLKFGFVRNPYDRLISAYVDKVFRPDIGSYEYNAQLHSLYGDDNNNPLRQKFSGNGSVKPSFKKFVQAAYQVLKQPRVTSNDTSKREAYEDNSSRRDLHWRPQNELLHTDIVPVDFIGRYERLESDRNKVMRWMYQHTDRRFTAENEQRLHASDPEMRNKLLKQLQRDGQLREMVAQMYQDDFSRFHIPINVPEIAEPELEIDQSD